MATAALALQKPFSHVHKERGWAACIRPSAPFQRPNSFEWEYIPRVKLIFACGVAWLRRCFSEQHRFFFWGLRRRRRRRRIECCGVGPDVPINAQPKALWGAQKLATFREAGFFRARGQLSLQKMIALEEQYWQGENQLNGCHPLDPQSWAPRREKSRPVRGLFRMGQARCFRGQPAIDEVIKSVHDSVDAVFGAGCWRVPHGSKVISLLNFPMLAGTWNLPCDWHTDAPCAAGDPPFLFAFLYLDSVGEHGGGTLMLAGSVKRGQLLLERAWDNCRKQPRLHSVEFQRVLMEDEPLLSELFAQSDREERVHRFMVEGIVSKGVPLKVIELTGVRGDIVVWDPRCLHTIAPNVSARPRPLLRFKLLPPENQ